MTAVTNADTPELGRTLPERIQQRAALHPNRTAITFLPDDYFYGDASPIRLTYAEIWKRALEVGERIAAAMQEIDGKAAEEFGQEQPRVLLLFPAGVDFVIGFLGTQLAGCIPVPTCFPKPHRDMPRLNAAASDCEPSLLLTDSSTRSTLAMQKLPSAYRELPVLTLDPGDGDDQLPRATLELLRSPVASADEIALLQYTSGSTSEPRGVIIRHRQLMTNLEAIRDGFGLEYPDHAAEDDDASIDVGVFWLPFYHDMGLIGGILEPLYIGGHSVLMSPRAFLQRPIRWLQVISDYNATVTGAPNFAYQLCVDRIPPEQTDALRLQSLKVAFSGAEPISSRTLRDFEHRFSPHGFHADAFYPCYGLAESTLLVAGGRGPARPSVLVLDRKKYEEGELAPLAPQAAANARKRDRIELVCCGAAVKAGEIEIADPETNAALGELEIGEIWVRGGSVADGYWHRDAESLEPRFQAVLSDDRGGFCRTGDLGFKHRGELYVTGRVKEMIILRGRNLYPQDIEASVRDCIRDSVRSRMGKSDDSAESESLSAEVSFGLAAAFAVSDSRSEALAIIAELPRQAELPDLADLTRAIRRAVMEVHEVDPKHIVLVRSATIPVTTSGKIRRAECKLRFLDDSFAAKHRYDRSGFSEQSPIPFPEFPSDCRTADREAIKKELENWMSDWLVARGGVDPAVLTRDTPLTECGLDSMAAVELSGEVEDWTGVRLTPEVSWNNPSIATLCDYVAETYLANSGKSC